MHYTLYVDITHASGEFRFFIFLEIQLLKRSYANNLIDKRDYGLQEFIFLHI